MVVRMVFGVMVMMLRVVLLVVFVVGESCWHGDLLEGLKVVLCCD